MQVTVCAGKSRRARRGDAAGGAREEQGGAGGAVAARHVQDPLAEVRRGRREPGHAAAPGAVEPLAVRRRDRAPARRVHGARAPTRRGQLPQRQSHYWYLSCATSLLSLLCLRVHDGIYFII